MMWTDLLPLAADLVVVVGALSLLVADLVLPPGDKRVLSVGALATLVGALACTWLLDLSGPALGHTYVGDGVALWFKRAMYAAGIVAVLGGLGSVPQALSRRQGEYYELLLFSVLGMGLVAGAADLLLLVVGFELMGLPLYVLAALDRADRDGGEGALKLFLTGALSSVALLFGAAWLSGMAGSTSLADIAQHVVTQPTPVAALGGVMLLAGMGFKLGLVPFHMWVPDAYEGSTTPFVAFLSTAPKAGGAVAMLRVVAPGEGALLVAAAGLLMGLAALSILAGNLFAMNQQQAKRLLAYSGVAHVGLLVMALASGSQLGVASLQFYVVAYVFSNAGAFLVVHAVTRSGGDGTVAAFDGLATRHQGLAMTMLAFLLSLAGIPFMVGFWAKLFVFTAAWQAGWTWMVVLAALWSVVGLYVYLRVARAMFMQPPTSDAPVHADTGVWVALALCLAVVVGLGLMPGPVMEAMVAAAGTLASP